MRLFGKGPEQGRIYRRRPGAYGVILAKNGLLITRQDSPKPDWQLPGGGVDAGESMMHALHREVMEETGSTVSVIRRLGAYQTFTYMAEYEMWANKICHIYLCQNGRQIQPPSEPHHESHVMDVDDAVNTLSSEGDRFFVKHYFGL
jgi:8-oxo-dGTP diphosphatase